MSGPARSRYRLSVLVALVLLVSLAAFPAAAQYRITDLTFLPDFSRVVAYDINANGTVTGFWAPGDGSWYAYNARDINDSNVIVGASNFDPFNVHATLFQYDDSTGTLTSRIDLGTADNFGDSYGYGVNRSGHAVGQTRGYSLPPRA